MGWIWPVGCSLQDPRLWQTHFYVSHMAGRVPGAYWFNSMAFSARNTWVQILTTHWPCILEQIMSSVGPQFLQQ